MQRIDTERLIQNNPIEDVIGRYISLKKDGAHLKGQCPFHDDQHASLTVTPKKNIAKCFACGWSGDVIAFVMEYSGKTFHEACEEIDKASVSDFAGNKKHVEKNVQVWKNIHPDPYAEEPTISHYRHGTPSKVWTYYGKDCQPIGYVCRFDLPDGKEVLPYTYNTDGTRKEWRWQGFDAPRPLYNLHAIEAHPNATILLVEGEKSADAAQAHLDPGRVVVSTWPGGSMAISHIDWSPIHGRKVLMWADNDVQGISAMLHIRQLNKGKFTLNKLVPLDATLPKGWDCADKEWEDGELKDFVLSRLVDDIPPNSGEMWRMAQVDRESFYEFGMDADRWVFRKIEAPEPPKNPPPPPEHDIYEPSPEDIENHSEEHHYTPHFKFLGFDKSDGLMRHHFFQLEAKVTLTYSPSQIGKAALISLAPLRFWETYFPGKKTGIDIDAAQEFITRTSISTGPFDEKYVRGRGAWSDQDRVVIHTGRELIVDGKLTKLGQIKSRYVYETSYDLGIGRENPLKTKEANRLIELLEYLNWDREVNSRLLAGWIVLAPFCGALRWRPHIWLTGSAGTGKSWVFEKIVRRLLGDTVLSVQGETTEAGLRQTLNHDALPVVFDEVDIEDKRGSERVQNILTLMRSASTDDGGILLKGSATGSAKSYTIRSCFAFASISVQAHQQSDRSRITILSMRQLPKDSPERIQRWNRCQELHHEIITDDFVSRLQARSIQLLPIIMKNAKTFSNAAAGFLGEQRQGDQLGPLLAGAFSLFSDKELTYEQAYEWVAKNDWTEEKQLDQSKDEKALLAYILDQMTMLELEHSKVERTIGELVMMNISQQDYLSEDIIRANDRLKRLGMKVDGEFLLISNSSEQIRRILKDSPWANNHSRILLRLKNAQSKNSVRFASGNPTRAVAIPLDNIISE